MEGSFHIYPAAESDCGYWPDGRLRRLFGLSTRPIGQLLKLEEGASIETYNEMRPAIFAMQRDGYRSSAYMAFATACVDCANPCFSLRINLDEFSFSKSNRRTLKRSSSLKFRKNTPHKIMADPGLRRDMFDLYKKYIYARHPDNESMRDKTYESFTAWIKQHNRIGTVEAQDGTLLGFSLCETHENEWKFGYCVFDPDHKGMSLGKIQWLRLILEAHNEGYDYIYVGDWSKDSSKLHYKTGYSGLEIYTAAGWAEFTPANDHEPVDFVEKMETTFYGLILEP